MIGGVQGADDHPAADGQSSTDHQQSVDGYHDISANLRVWLDRLIACGPPPVLYDVGANRGQLTLPVASSLLRLVAFEPDHLAAEQLRRNGERAVGPTHRSVDVFEIALADRSGSAELIRYSDDTFNTLFARTDDEKTRYGLRDQGRLSVPVTFLDDFLRVPPGDALPAPDIVKIDVEGAELAVLRGARQTLAAARPAVIVEYSCVNTANAGYDRTEIFDALDALGYAVFGLFRNEDTTPRGKTEFFDCRIWNLVALHPLNPRFADVVPASVTRG